MEKMFKLVESLESLTEKKLLILIIGLLLSRKEDRKELVEQLTNQ